MQKQKELDLLHGSLWNKILWFALPLAASSILQQLFNSADVAVVGRFAGSEALAAVGSNGPIINLLVNIFVGLSVGANVMIARFLGEGNQSQVRKAVHTTVLIALVSGLIIMTLGLIITRPILQLIATPSDIIDLSTLYLRIYFLGMPFMMLYNFGSAILRSRGDTKTPFICLLISGIINVLLNLFFVIVCKLSVAGVGLATVISNVISASLILWFLIRDKGVLKVELRQLKIDVDILKSIAKIGLPAGLQGVVFSLSNICIQSALNTLGSATMAGSAAALNFEYFVYFLLNAFTQACVTFTGQNYGAGEYGRCQRITRLCLLMGFTFSTALSLIFFFAGRGALRFYTTDAAVIEIGLVRMKYCLVMQFISVFMDVLSGSMRGLGYSLTPAIISFAGSCAFRLLWVYTVFPLSPSFHMLILSYPISWLISSAASIVAYLIIKKLVLHPAT